ncbi:MAG: ribbon-helix-helix domain-containing protein [Chloroflexi bacterium]|nr:ribbon-helix-helix domain-containing protein [Chloroflexota bacterium]MBU1750771.1 ribbon-helix-helix domain-containing protein [Chloroflexota bacterium]MBU1878859.1 ribbon-helix-helix domain-containing protein [Chloroflexota bacterium]
MSIETSTVRKVTISLPADLVEFTDRQADRLAISRSRFITQALAQLRAKEEERLAAEGYRFYAQEASEFAVASAGAVAEAWNHAR